MTYKDGFLNNITNTSKFFPDETKAQTPTKKLTTKNIQKCQINLINAFNRNDKIDSTKEPLQIEKSYNIVTKIIKEINEIEQHLSSMIQKYETRIVGTTKNEDEIEKVRVNIELLVDHHEASLDAIKKLKTDKEYLLEDLNNIPVHTLKNMEINRKNILKRIRRYK